MSNSPFYKTGVSKSPLLQSKIKLKKKEKPHQDTSSFQRDQILSNEWNQFQLDVHHANPNPKKINTRGGRVFGLPSKHSSSHVKLQANLTPKSKSIKIKK